MLTSRWLSVAALVVAALVAGFSIAQALREHRFEPILQLAWLPAVIVAAYSARPRPGRSCADRVRGSARRTDRVGDGE
jgi:hypothetical protein